MHPYSGHGLSGPDSDRVDEIAHPRLHASFAGEFSDGAERIVIVQRLGGARCTQCSGPERNEGRRRTARGRRHLSPDAAGRQQEWDPGRRTGSQAVR